MERWLHPTAWIVVGATAFLLVAGALVTSTGSGLAVPDWPLSYGQLMPPMEGGVFYEHGHRMVAGVVLILVTFYAVLCWKFSKSDLLKCLSISACGLVFFQAILGGMTVLFKLPPQISIFHACIAQIFFCLTVLMVWVSAPTFQKLSPSIEDQGLMPLRWLAGLVSLGFFVQLLFGASMRHLGAGLAIPDFPTVFGAWWPVLPTLETQIHFAHRAGAFVLVGLAVYLCVRIYKESTPLSIVALAGALLALVFSQVVLGAMVIWLARPVWLTPLHLLIGAICLALSVLLTAQLFYLTDKRALRQGVSWI